MKNRTKCLSKRMSDPISKKSSFKRLSSSYQMDAKNKAHSKSCAHQRSHSNLHVPEAYNKKEVITKEFDEKGSASDPISSLMNRFNSLFQRRGSNQNNNSNSTGKTPESKQSPLSQSSNSICHISSNNKECSASGELTKNFDKVNRELLKLKKFREGCE